MNDDSDLMVIRRLDRHYSVRLGDLYEDKLNWDEALGCVAAWLTGRPKLPYLSVCHAREEREKRFQVVETWEVRTDEHGS